MPHEDYVPASLPADYRFESATYPHLSARSAARAPEPPAALPEQLVRSRLLLALLGVVCVLFGQYRIATANATRGWIETSAVISSAKLRGSGNSYHLDLSYQYRAGPREREGSRIALTPARSREAVYAYAGRFRPGARVPAWFDPAAPDSVVLEREKVAAPWAPGAIGALLFLVGLFPFVRQLFRHLRYRRALATAR
jgi:Protein of unknown function (DUF3592).